MNDAGQDTESGSRPARVAWFQVSLTEHVPATRPVPVQAFLACAGNVLARLGALRLTAVQMLLPIQILDASKESASRQRLAVLFRCNGWFADCEPDQRTPVRVTLDGGQDSLIGSAAAPMAEWMTESKQDVFRCESFSLADDDDMGLQAGIIDELWNGPRRYRVTFRGTLAEWSFDAVGWLATLLCEVSARNGVTTPLILTADRSEESTSSAG